MLLKSLILSCLMGSSAWAVNTPLEMPANPLPVTEEPPAVTCDNVVEELRKHNQMARGNDAAFADFVTQVSMLLGDWFTEWSPHNGNTWAVPLDEFNKVDVKRGEVEEVVSMVYDNSAFLETRLNQLIDVVDSCTKKK